MEDGYDIRPFCAKPPTARAVGLATSSGSTHRMNVDQVKEVLGAKGFVLDEEKKIQYGVQLKFTNGSLVSVFDKGTVSPQGKDVELVNQLLGLAPGRQAAPAAVAKKVASNNKVFVVYGHEEQARARLDAMLRRWGLEPLILDQLPSEPGFPFWPWHGHSIHPLRSEQHVLSR